MTAPTPSIPAASIRRWCIWRGVGIGCCVGPFCARSPRVGVARVALAGLIDERPRAVVGAA
jgi:hypothetical protein